MIATSASSLPFVCFSAIALLSALPAASAAKTRGSNISCGGFEMSHCFRTMTDHDKAIARAAVAKYRKVGRDWPTSESEDRGHSPKPETEEDWEKAIFVCRKTGFGFELHYSKMCAHGCKYNSAWSDGCRDKPKESKSKAN